jgi:hypothetical protein
MLRIENLAKSYGSKEVLRELTCRWKTVPSSAWSASTAPEKQRYYG